MSILIRNLYVKCSSSFVPVTKVHQQFCKNYSHATLQLNMNEALLLHEEGSPKFEMQLRYVNSDLNVDRNFNFQRNVNECISTFLSRIDRNINASLTKKKSHKKKKMTNNDGDSLMEAGNNYENDNTKFVRNQTVLDGDLTCKSILESSSDIRLIIFGTEYVLRQNVPYVKKIELPSSILVGFPTYPSKFETTNVDRTTSTFNWYRNVGQEWVHVGEGYLYTPNKSDLGCRLKVSCEPRNGTQCGPTVEIGSNDIVQTGPGPCPFDTRHAFTKTRLSGKSFRVTTYNILANIYAETSLSKETLYPYCPHYALSMDYRKLLILKELIGYNTDIICLQEVDGKIYENDLVLSLGILNYDSVYNNKNEVREGLAIFYNNDRFEKLDTDYSVMCQGTDLDEFNTIWTRIENDNVKQVFQNRNTIIQVVVLRSKENPEILIVGNTHLYFRPDADQIRLLQAYYGLLYLRRFATKMKREYPECNVSILYCGDFNTAPENAIYQLMTQKSIPEDHGDWKSSPNEHVENVSIKHDLNISSACGAPEYTNYTATFCGCLDYIFYETDYLEVEQVVPMPSNEELSAYTGLPSVVCPSDHISLCADLKWSK